MLSLGLGAASAFGGAGADVRSRSNPTRLPSTLTIRRAGRCPDLGNDAQRRHGGPPLPDRRSGAVAVVNVIHARPL